MSDDDEVSSSLETELKISISGFLNTTQKLSKFKIHEGRIFK